MPPEIIRIIEPAQVHAREFPHFTLADGRHVRLFNALNKVAFLGLIVMDERLRNPELQQAGLKKLGNNRRDVHLPLLTRARLKNLTIQCDHFPAKENDQLRARRTGHDNDHILGYPS